MATRDMKGKRLDLSSDSPAAEGECAESMKRRFLGLRFDCCGVYTRIYINREQNAYSGHCPKCSRTIQINAGPSRTDEQFFTAY